MWQLISVFQAKYSLEEQILGNLLWIVYLCLQNFTVAENILHIQYDEESRYAHFLLRITIFMLKGSAEDIILSLEMFIVEPVF